MRVSDDICTSKMASRLIGLMKTATKAGIFKNVVLRKNTFNPRIIKEEMMAITGEEETTDPTQEPPLVKTKKIPTSEEVQKLRDAAASESPRDSLLVAVLSTTGLRLKAISRMTIHQIWDRKQRCAQKSFVTIEKNSEQRVIQPCETLRRHIEAFASSPSGRNCHRYVFSEKGKSRFPPNSLTLRRRLYGLCSRAGVRPLNPHSFRAYVITMLRERGIGPDVACKFVGHKSLQTQNQYYWMEDVESLAMNAISTSDGETVRGLRRQILEAQERLNAASGRAECLRALEPTVNRSLPVGPPPLTYDDGIEAVLRKVCD